MPRLTRENAQFGRLWQGEQTNVKHGPGVILFSVAVVNCYRVQRSSQPLTSALGLSAPSFRMLVTNLKITFTVYFVKLSN